MFLSTDDLISPGISACQGCAAEYILRTAMKVMGPNSILGVPPGCMAGAGVVGWNRLSGAKVPVTIPLLDNSASLMAGVKRYYSHIDRNDIKVIVFAGDGATADVGFQALSGAAERGENIIYLCYDNEGYMNTGFQRSGTTTKGSITSTTPLGKLKKGKREHKKDIPLLMAMHDCSYVATISPAYTNDFINKLQKAKMMEQGFVYLHILSPCPTGWKFSPEKVFAIARLAVETDFFPLWEYEGGKFRQTVFIKEKKPVREFLNKIGKFNHLSNANIEDLQQWVNRKSDLLNRLFTNI